MTKLPRELSDRMVRLYGDQVQKLEALQTLRHSEPADVVRGATDFYIPIFEAHAQDVSASLIIKLSQALRLVDEEKLHAMLETVLMDLGAGSIAAFPAEVRREVRQHARKLKRERRVANSR